VRLSRLVTALEGAALHGFRDAEVCGLAFDSRRVTPGALFVAVPAVGGDVDSGGSRFIASALEKGAAAIVVPAGVAPPAGVPVVVVPNARAALADLAAEFYGHPSRRLALFAVTGTDGKTTTTYLLEQVLRRAGFATGLIGTVETRIGEQARYNTDRMTTPESPDVQRLLAEMADAAVTHVAMEASSHALALDRLRGCSFAACAVTNITADHVEFHGSWEAYFAAKARLFTDLAAGRPSVLNRDDRHFDRLRAMIDGPVTTYGFHPSSDVRATDLRGDPAGSCFVVHSGGESRPAHLPLAGPFNVSNALAVAALAAIAGLPLEAIVAALARVEGPPGRMQRVDAGQDFTVLVDYAHTPHAFRTVVESVRHALPPDRRLIAVFGAAGDRDRAKRPELARIARELTDFFFITNEDPFGEDAAAIIAEIAAGVPPDEEGERYRCEPDRGRAIAQALAAARAGDAVVILGKGHEQNIVTGSHREPWSDALTARAALEALR